MPIKGLLFDLDGTVTNTLPLCIKAFREAIEPLAGRAVPDAEIAATFGPSEEGTIRALAPEHYERGLADYLFAYERLLRPEHGPFPGITDWLCELKSRGMRLGVVTGKGPRSAQLTLRRFKLEGFFEQVGTGSPTGPVKAERIREITARWGIPPEEIAYVGDAPSDVEAARRAGVGMIGAAWLCAGEAELAGLEAARPDVARSIDRARRWIKAQEAVALFEIAQRLQAMAQTGLAFTRDHYDVERYEALRDIAARIVSLPVDPPDPALVRAFAGDVGYATPKVDVRGVVLREGRMLFGRETHDGLWSLPGGWADVGDRPGEAVVREVREETGLITRVERFLGVFDHNLHGHPPHPRHIYKLFFLCREVGGELRTSEETLDVGFFDPLDPPPLSLPRITPEELQICLKLARTGGPAYYD